MDLIVSTKCGANGSDNFSKAQLQEIAASLCIRIPDNMRLVYYGQAAPLDTTVAWQPTNGCGDPVGKVKSFKNGNWHE